MQSQRIYDFLRKGILTCELPPGRGLREQELAQQFDVSKSPVREALQHLVSEGLVIVIPRQGYRVSPVSLRDANEIFGFRQALELSCIAEAVKSGSDAELKALDEFRVFNGDYDSEFIAYNQQFHFALARCSNNGRMARAACELIEETERLVRLSVATVRGTNEHKFVEEHNAIITAVQNRDSRRSVSLLKSHVSGAVKRYSTALEWTVMQV
ncbi:MAG: GntR family transcriptional regulator [Alcaligenaceae bacterium]|nr:MAG: GntR family transcriptional regulator [Alcaligenaceae bacterium]